MKKVFSVCIALLVMLSVFASPVQETTASEEKTLTIYAYDTFLGEWGAEGAVIPAFEEATGIKVTVVSPGSAAETINRIVLDGDKTDADVIFGVSNDLAPMAYDFLEPYNTPLLDTIDERLKFDDQNRLIPFDWSSFAFVYDTESDVPAPTSLEDLTKDEYKGKVILIAPPSTVGTGLMMWTYNALGENWLDWWKTMAENALTMAPKWSTAYGLFTEGEAPIVISYTTSPVYHVMWEDTTRYQALVFGEGHQATIEGMGIVKGTKHREEAEAFIDFVLTSAQVDIANANSMYPVNLTIELPEAYNYAPVPETYFYSVGNEADAVFEEWSKAVLGR